ncbi:MAG: Hsp20/alpha crystallin family protein [Rhodospirillales bacterium]|nr:Hsp20/alpha crystallin family protein [Rhodospirillales bacterium]
MADTQIQMKPDIPAPAPRRALDLFSVFRGEMDQLFDRFFGGGLPGLFRGPRGEPAIGATAPAVEVAETDTAWTLSAELPGLDEKDIEIALAGDTLTLSGEKRQASEKTEGNTTFSERSYGAFARSFALPDGVDREKIDAQFEKGVLKITLPKTAEAKTEKRVIPVTPAA